MSPTYDEIDPTWMAAYQPLLQDMAVTHPLAPGATRVYANPTEAAGPPVRVECLREPPHPRLPYRLSYVLPDGEATP